jgi:branched-chain amino acid transport system ATP-binding protein
MPISGKNGRRSVRELLSLQNIDVHYGDVQVLWNCALDVREGEAVALFGGNGVGKTSLLRAVSRLTSITSGRILFAGRDISALQPHELPQLGIAHVPEGRHVFAQMTVQENLELGGYAPRVRKMQKQRMKSVYELFPVLQERRNHAAGVLSGGQQQMLAIGRGLMAEPRLLMLDEPSLGLAPSIVATLFETIRRIKSSGVTIVLVEQNLWEALEVADRYYLMESGRIVSSGTPGQLQENESFRQVYLGL